MGGRSVKTSWILLCSRRLSSGKGCEADRKASGEQRENLGSHYAPTPAKWPPTCDLTLVPEEHLRHAGPAPMSNRSGLRPASTPSPLSASHLPGMSQDSVDQCLQDAPKNDLVARGLSHLAPSARAPLLRPSGSAAFPHEAPGVGAKHS